MSSTAVAGAQPPAPTAETVHWFQATEQALMDAVAVGDKAVWDATMDPACVVTTEEGQLLDKKRFLDELKPLPAGLRGGIAVRELTVQELGAVAVVRFLLDEWEQVFAQRLTTRYRTTDTFRRVGGAWKLVASHTSVVTQDPPAQAVATSAWPSFVGKYQLAPNGWTLTVELRDGKLYGGRDPAKLRPFVPLAPNAFVLADSLGEWVFAANDRGQVDRVVDLRKFEVLIWTKLEVK